jgi:hypothetical protein
MALAAAVAFVTLAAVAQGASRPRTAPVIDGQYIVVLRGAAGAETADLERRHGFKAKLRYGRALKGFAARLSARQVERLEADPAVARVAPDRPVRAYGAIAAGETVPTGVRRIGAATASAAHDAAGVNVAVIDTGIDLANADLNAASGRNCVNPGAAAQDDNGHGTHVAGTIAARNDGAGLIGVAPGTKLYAAKVLDAAGSGTESQVICGIDWVASTRTDADPANDVRVANLSLGGLGAPVGSCASTTDPEHLAICRATDLGVTFVVAAGNSGWDFDYVQQPDVPAAYPEVLTVSAMSDSDGRGGAGGGAPGCDSAESDDSYAKFSNFASTAAGQGHTIAGPGTCIASNAIGGGTAVMSGTSMATPHLAGAVALCMGEAGTAGPCASLAPADVIQRMRATAASHNAANSGYGFTGDPLRAFAGAYFGHLTVASLGDTTAPTVGTVAPSAGAVAVVPTSSVSATFSEPMDAAATQGAFSLRAADGTVVAGIFSWSGSTLTFRPSAPLREGTTYTATISTGARDRAGNALATARSWAFKTQTTVTSSPFATTITAGSLRAGDYTRWRADDDVYFQASSTTSGTRTSDLYARFSGVSNALRSLRLTHKGKSSVSCSQALYLYNWTRAVWVQIDARTVGTTEVLVDRSVTSGFADYVSGTSGDGEVRLRVRCTASASFVTSGDLMRVTFTKP